MNYIVSCFVACWKSGVCSVFVFALDLSSHPWPCWDIVHVWLRVSSWLFWNAGQLSVHGKSKSVVVIPLWLISESFAHPWLHCGGGNGTKTLFVSFQKCASFSSDVASEGRYRGMSPWRVLSVMILRLQDLKEPFNLFHALLTVSSWLCCVRIIFPPTTDYQSDVIICTILLNTSYLQKASLNEYSSCNMVFVMTAALYVMIYPQHYNTYNILQYIMFFIRTLVRSSHDTEAWHHFLSVFLANAARYHSDVKNTWLPLFQRGWLMAA